VFEEALKLYAEKQLGKLEETIKINFKDKSLLIKALSHRSPLGNSLTSKDENRRLGLIGDKLIDLVLFENLYRKGSSLKEMDDARQSTSIGPKLSAIGRNLGLEQYMFFNEGTENHVIKESQSLFEDSFEAIVGALYLDRGFMKAVGFVKRYLINALSTNTPISN
jgi:ribonuclease-3